VNTAHVRMMPILDCCTHLHHVTYLGCVSFDARNTLRSSKHSSNPCNLSNVK